MKAPTLTIGGLPVTRATRGDLCAIMLADVRAARAGELPFPRFVTSANGSVVAVYHSDPFLRSAIDRADIVDADGMPLVFASRLFCRDPLVERTATTDFVLDASQMAAREGIRFYFLGARQGVAARAAETCAAAIPICRWWGAPRLFLGWRYSRDLRGGAPFGRRCAVGGHRHPAAGAFCGEGA